MVLMMSDFFHMMIGHYVEFLNG